MLGKTLGHYRILEKIGAGGMGEVYRARDEHLDRDVAIKVLPAGLLGDEAARKRFRKEALALSKLNHPNIQTVFDFDTQEGVDFLAVEYIPGESLDEKLAAGSLAEKEVTRWGMQLAEGLAAAHEQGVVHRDLKPANLRLTPDDRLKILDFGLAKLLRPEADLAGAATAATTESLTEMQAVAGTLPYMAPEQLRGESLDVRTDIWAAGAVLYELATGRRPFPEDSAPRLTDSILHAPPVAPRALNPRLSLGLESLILKCLEKDPESRYQSAKELAVDLRRLAAPTAIPHAPSPQAPAWGKSVRRALPLVGIAAIALVAVLLVWNVGGLRERWFGTASPGRIESLAVLPLDNLSRDPEQDYFVEGMHEALITELSKIGALRVISRTSAMQYKGVQKPLPEIANELNVDAVIEGSVLRADARVRITAQLIGLRPERHLWAQSYDRELSDILALTSDVARAVAAEIKLTLTPQEQARLARAGRVNAAAHEAYLLGQHHLRKGTRLGAERALEYFRQAISQQPDYAQAHAGLAEAHIALVHYVGPHEAMPPAKAAAQKAIELDPSLAEAHASLGYVKLFYGWDWAAAEQEFKRALELNPNSAKAHLDYGSYLAVMGRTDEAFEETRRAFALDPLSVTVRLTGIYQFWVSRRYEEVIHECQKVLEVEPGYAPAHAMLAAVYSRQGRRAEALAAADQARALPGSPVMLAWVGQTYAEVGHRRQAEQLLLELLQLSEQRYVCAYNIAAVYLALGNKQKAFESFDKAFEQRSD